MPGKSAHVVTTFVFHCLIVSLSYLSFPSKSCTTLSMRRGMNTKGAPFISSPPDGIVKVGKWGYLSFEVITNNLAGNPFLTSQTDAWRFEPPRELEMVPVLYVVS